MRIKLSHHGRGRISGFFDGWPFPPERCASFGPGGRGRRPLVPFGGGLPRPTTCCGSGVLLSLAITYVNAPMVPSISVEVLEWPFARHQSRQERLHDLIRRAPQFIRPQSIERDLARFVPLRQLPHF